MWRAMIDQVSDDGCDDWRQARAIVGLTADGDWCDWR